MLKFVDKKLYQERFGNNNQSQDSQIENSVELTHSFHGFDSIIKLKHKKSYPKVNYYEEDFQVYKSLVVTQSQDILNLTHTSIDHIEFRIKSEVKDREMIDALIIEQMERKRLMQAYLSNQDQQKIATANRFSQNISQDKHKSILESALRGSMGKTKRQKMKFLRNRWVWVFTAQLLFIGFISFKVKDPIIVYRDSILQQNQ